MKNLLLSAFVVLGLSITVNAQNLDTAVTCPPVQTLTCAGTPTSPIPGTTYDYTVTVGNSTAGTYNWFVTTDPNFMAGGTLTSNIETDSGDIILASGSGYNNTAPGGTATQQISWESAPATGDVFLVIHYTDTSGCDNDNLKVYKIDIKNNFVIDVYNVTSAGGANTTLGTDTATPTICAPKVESAKYENNQMTYVYGKTYVYYVISAANFMDNWDLKFKVNANLNTTPTNSEQNMKVFWSNDGTSGWTELSAVSEVYSTKVTGVSGFNASDCIVVKIEVENNEFESLVNQEVKLIADATYTSGTKVIDDVDSNCSPITGFEKEGKQIISPRPSVTSNTAGGAFIPKD